FRASARAQQATLIERIDKNVAVLRFVFCDEVKWQAHPFDRESDSSGYNDVDYCQGNGYSHSSIDDFIEKAVSGIVVALAVTAKSPAIKESRVEGRDRIDCFQRAR